MADDWVSTVAGEERSEGRTIKGALVSDVVDEKDAHGAAVVCGGDGAEALLAGRVPDLQLDALAIEVNGANLEIYTNGGDEGGRE